MLTSPTGGGKTFMAEHSIREALQRGMQATLYTHRRLLADQTRSRLEESGLDVGLRMSGEHDKITAPVQVAMVQTEQSRVLKAGDRSLHRSGLVIVDECHTIKGKVIQQILKQHRDDGAIIVGLTATPVGLAGMYDEIIVAGTNSELRGCGAHALCVTYSPDQPDTRHVRRNSVGEYTYNQLKKMVRVQQIFGRVYDNWLELNPEMKPTLLFAPGVKESKWFTKLFHDRGVSAAHIDGNNVYWNGKEYKSDLLARNTIMEMSKSGEIKIICNRFVFREGIDAPWMAHGIAATPFGGMSSYLQSGGRIIRAAPGLERVIWQDHGGNYWRHGSLNEDRNWKIEDTNPSVAKDRENVPKEREPIRCRKCGAERLGGMRCHQCGHEESTTLRMVLQANGQLKEMDVKKQASKSSSLQKVWDKYFFSAKKSRSNRPLTFKSALFLFRRETGAKTYTEGAYTFARLGDEPGQRLQRVPPADSELWGSKIRDSTYRELV